MNLKVTKETDSGLNTEFVNTDSGRRITLNQAVEQINRGNPSYNNYNVVVKKNGTTYIRSNPDKKNPTILNNL